MHELSIVESLVEIAEAAARDANAAQVKTVHLKLGEFADVVKEALLFAYDTVTEGTVLGGSTLDVEDVPLIIYCTRCKQETPPVAVQLLACPRCGTFSNDIRQGKELELVSLEIVDYANTASTDPAGGFKQK